jgi:Sulfotransferase family
MTKIAQSQGVQLRVEDLLEQAQTHTGLRDFGDPWFREPLEVLVDCINTEAGLPSLDVVPVRHMVSMLCERLRFVDYLKRTPAVYDEEIDVVGVILGQARGGSTLTQRLTAQSPQLRTTFFWETFAPIPLPGEKVGDYSARRKIGDEVIADWLKRMPAYVGVHPLSSENYDEEIWFMDRGFNSYMYTLHFNVPSYYQWLLKQDQRKNIEELIVWFKILQYNMPERKGRKWLCKNQQYIMACCLPLVMEMFPKAQLIHTHRPMEEALASLCSVQSFHIKDSGSINFDPKEMGERIIGQYRTSMRHLISVNKASPDRFINIKYRDLVADPIGQYRTIIEGMGLNCGIEDIAAAEKWMASNHRGTHPPHGYRPEDFGVTAQQLREAFKFYHDEFLS